MAHCSYDLAIIGHDENGKTPERAQFGTTATPHGEKEIKNQMAFIWQTENVQLNWGQTNETNLVIFYWTHPNLQKILSFTFSVL